MTMTKSQEQTVNAVKAYCPAAEVTQDGLLFINWTNNEDHSLLKESYMAVIGPRGGFKIISADSALVSDKHRKTLAQLCLYRLGIRGTIKL